nr:MAG TPA: hypothetical protein [Caudoviricetes sp.]
MCNDYRNDGETRNRVEYAQAGGSAGGRKRPRDSLICMETCSSRKAGTA